MNTIPAAANAPAELSLLTIAVLLASLPAGAAARSDTPAGLPSAGTDMRLREIIYDPQGVVTVPVKRGIVTLVVLDADESITELAAGLGSDCSKAESAWCIAAQPGGRTVFIKPKSKAAAANNLAVVTGQRIHNLSFQVLADNDPRPPLYRLVIRGPNSVRAMALAEPRSGKASEEPSPADRSLQVLGQLEAGLQAVIQASSAPPHFPAQQVAERLQAKPRVLNTRYSLAEGEASQDIVPTLVFDDGRFTYLRLPGNREMPAVFQVLGDGSEALVNVRVEDDLLVVDRVARQLLLRAGTAVVGLWNEAFDIEGVPPDHGTTVPGVRRSLRTFQGIQAIQEVQHSPARRLAPPEPLSGPDTRPDGDAR